MIALMLHFGPSNVGTGCLPTLDLLWPEHPPAIREARFDRTRDSTSQGLERWEYFRICWSGRKKRADSFQLDGGMNHAKSNIHKPTGLLAHWGLPQRAADESELGHNAPSRSGFRILWAREH